MSVRESGHRDSAQTRSAMGNQTSTSTGGSFKVGKSGTAEPVPVLKRASTMSAVRSGSGKFGPLFGGSKGNLLSEGAPQSTVLRNDGFAPGGTAGSPKSPGARGPGSRPVGMRHVGGSQPGTMWPAFGVSSVQGVRKTMEDEHVVVPSLLVGPGGDNTAMFGVFDGHGGWECSSYIKKNLPAIIKEQLKKQDPTSALKSAFMQADKNFVDQVPRIAEDAGSTGVVVLAQRGKIIVAHAGDSRATLRRNGVASLLTKDHKPLRPDENKRIKQCGGAVVMGRVSGRLAVSRAFGNKPLKRYVTADPEIQVIQLDPRDDFVLLCSDGLHDVIDDEQAFMIVQEAIDQGKGLQGAARALTTKAVTLGSKDNVTVVVLDCSNYDQVG